MEAGKLVKTAKGLDVFANIAEKLLYVITAMLIIIGIVVGVEGDHFAVDDLSVQLGYANVRLRESGEVSADNIRAFFVAVVIFAAVVPVLYCIGLRIIRRILAPMKDGRPFDTNVSVELRRLGWLVLVGGIVSNLMDFALEAFFIKSVDLTSLFNMDVVEDVTYNFITDWTFLVFMFVLFLLSYVFRYGEELQCESDETL